MLTDLISNEAAVLHAGITTRCAGNTQTPEIQCLEECTMPMSKHEKRRTEIREKRVIASALIQASSYSPVCAGADNLLTPSKVGLRPHSNKMDRNNQKNGWITTK